jgi:hypothetical protein
MESKEDFVQRTAALYQQLQADVDLDLIVYSPEEFERNRENPFIRNAVKTGKVIYEKKRV